MRTHLLLQQAAQELVVSCTKAATDLEAAAVVAAVLAVLVHREVLTPMVVSGFQATSRVQRFSTAVVAAAPVMDQRQVSVAMVVAVTEPITALTGTLASTVLEVAVVELVPTGHLLVAVDMVVQVLSLCGIQCLQLQLILLSLLFLAPRAPVLR
jgi:acetolactate synthase regulatory subunit